MRPRRADVNAQVQGPRWTRRRRSYSVLKRCDVARARTKNAAVASAADKALKTPPQPVTLDVGDIARRAYDLYLARGCEAGHDVDDWMQAERELRNPGGSGHR